MKKYYILNPVPQLQHPIHDEQEERQQREATSSFNIGSNTSWTLLGWRQAFGDGNLGYSAGQKSPLFSQGNDGHFGIVNVYIYAIYTTLTEFSLHTVELRVQIAQHPS